MGTPCTERLSPWQLPEGWIPVDSVCFVNNNKKITNMNCLLYNFTSLWYSQDCRAVNPSHCEFHVLWGCSAAQWGSWEFVCSDLCGTLAVYNRRQTSPFMELLAHFTVYQAASAAVLQCILKGVGKKDGRLYWESSLMKDLVHSGNMKVSRSNASLFTAWIRNT